MPTPIVQKCRSCQAPIVWAVTERRQRLIPLDAEGKTGAFGAFILDTNHAPPIARMKSRTDKGPFYLSHFATCPNAAEHRTKGAPIEER